MTNLEKNLVRKVRVTHPQGISVDKLLSEIASGINSPGYKFIQGFARMFYYFGFEKSDLVVGLFPGRDWQGRNIPKRAAGIFVAGAAGLDTFGGGLTEDEIREKFAALSSEYELSIIEGEIQANLLEPILRKIPDLTYSFNSS